MRTPSLLLLALLATSVACDRKDREKVGKVLFPPSIFFAVDPGNRYEFDDGTTIVVVEVADHPNLPDAGGVVSFVRGGAANAYLVPDERGLFLGGQWSVGRQEVFDHLVRVLPDPVEPARTYVGETDFAVHEPFGSDTAAGHGHVRIESRCTLLERAAARERFAFDEVIRWELRTERATDAQPESAVVYLARGFGPVGFEDQNGHGARWTRAFVDGVEREHSRKPVVGTPDTEKIPR